MISPPIRPNQDGEISFLRLEFPTYLGSIALAVFRADLQYDLRHIRLYIQLDVRQPFIICLGFNLSFNLFSRTVAKRNTQLRRRSAAIRIRSQQVKRILNSGNNLTTFRNNVQLNWILSHMHHVVFLFLVVGGVTNFDLELHHRCALEALLGNQFLRHGQRKRTRTFRIGLSLKRVKFVEANVKARRGNLNRSIRDRLTKEIFGLQLSGDFFTRAVIIPVCVNVYFEFGENVPLDCYNLLRLLIVQESRKGIRALIDFIRQLKIGGDNPVVGGFDSLLENLIPFAVGDFQRHRSIRDRFPIRCAQNESPEMYQLARLVHGLVACQINAIFCQHGDITLNFLLTDFRTHFDDKPAIPLEGFGYGKRRFDRPTRVGQAARQFHDLFIFLAFEPYRNVCIFHRFIRSGIPNNNSEGTFAAGFKLVLAEKEDILPIDGTCDPLVNRPASKLYIHAVKMQLIGFNLGWKNHRLTLTTVQHDDLLGHTIDSIEFFIEKRDSQIMDLRHL